MYQRVGPRHDLDRPIALADEVANDLDAMAPEVDDGPAARLALVPEPGAVRPGMGLPRSDPRDITDRSRPDRIDRLEGLGRVAEILQIAGEYARRLHLVQDSLGLFATSCQRFGAKDRLPGLGHGRN